MIKIIIENDSFGNDYRTVIIGNQQWTIDNLDIDKFRNGDSIQEVIPTQVNAWEVEKNNLNGEDLWHKNFIEKVPCYTYLASIPDNNKRYGKLYNSAVIFDSRGIGPDNFRVPTIADFEKLRNTLGNESGTQLKSKKSTDLALKKNNWASVVGIKTGNDKFGFNGLPSGFGDKTETQIFGMWYEYENRSAFYWTVDENNIDPKGEISDVISPCAAWLSYGSDELITGKPKYPMLTSAAALSIRLVRDI
jgi:uncharacterized protein (TIGR02145 family)